MPGGNIILRQAGAELAYGPKGGCWSGSVSLYMKVCTRQSHLNLYYAVTPVKLAVLWRQPVLYICPGGEL